MRKIGKRRSHFCQNHVSPSSAKNIVKNKEFFARWRVPPVDTKQKVSNQLHAGIDKHGMCPSQMEDDTRRCPSIIAHRSSAHRSLNIQVGPCHFRESFVTRAPDFGSPWSLYIRFAKLLWILRSSNPKEFCKSKFLYLECEIAGSYKPTYLPTKS